MMDKDASRRELDEILKQKPGWMIRWGIVLLSVLVMLGLGLWVLEFGRLPAIFRPN
jgi:hypothetical protein